jgi:alpha-L-fucosidase
LPNASQPMKIRLPRSSVNGKRLALGTPIYPTASLTRTNAMSFSPYPPLPSLAQLAWQRCETNLFLHFGINTFTGREWGDGSENPALFNPSRLDCAQWAQAAKAGGFKIAVLTAKHHDGFCLWPSHRTRHSVQSSPWKNGQGDLVRDFVDAFRAEGLKVGLYLSPWDRHEPCYGTESYNDFYCDQFTELLTQYGELHELWFDGACAEEPGGRKQVYDWDRFFALAKKLQPGAVTFGDGGTDVRWVGNERGIAGTTSWSSVDPAVTRFPGDSGIAQANDATAHASMEKLLSQGQEPDGRAARVWRPPECDVSIRPGWFYHEEEDGAVRSVENLVDLYFQSVGRNGTLLLNIPPNRDGLLAGQDVKNVAEFRRRLDELFRKDFALESQSTATSAHPDHPASRLLEDDIESYWVAAQSDSEPAIELELPFPREIGVVRLQEPVQIGQRIAAYRIEMRGANREWQVVAEGTTIGCKKLDRIAPVLAERIRIVIERSVAVPALSSIGLYAPPA